MNAAQRRVKAACYVTNISMSVVGNLPPLLFLTFRELYGISYTLLGLLVLLNFCTQLAVDLLFSFFSNRFDIGRSVRVTPALTVLGLLIYALFPLLFPNAVYVGLVLGTVVFSASAGLSEVLISPVIAALPAENKDREMSRLHSVYAWGVVLVVTVSAVFLTLLGRARWQMLVLLWAVVPLIAACLFHGAQIPEMERPERASKAVGIFRQKGLLLCVLCIFLGGASECTMAQWSSSYLEKAFNIPKLTGDILGVAMFGAALGLGRTLYTTRGKRLTRVLLLGAIGASICYLTATFCDIPALGLCACALTGFCVSMMWPGSLLIASGRFPAGGVAVFALMAAGGDLGASVAPQLVGLLTDTVAQSARGIALAADLGLTPDALGMKAGMLAAALFPLCAIWAFRRVGRMKETK